MRGMICGMAATLQQTHAPAALPERGLFMRGMRLVWSYIKLHPKPFAISRPTTS
jgi:hypothetical protein